MNNLEKIQDSALQAPETVGSITTYTIGASGFLIAHLADIAQISQSLIVIISLFIVTMRGIHDSCVYLSKLRSWLRKRRNKE